MILCIGSSATVNQSAVGVVDVFIRSTELPVEQTVSGCVVTVVFDVTENDEGVTQGNSTSFDDDDDDDDCLILLFPNNDCRFLSFISVFTL